MPDAAHPPIDWSMDSGYATTIVIPGREANPESMLQSKAGSRQRGCYPFRDKKFFLRAKKVVNPRLFFSAGVGHNSSIGLL
jgi:hypothetical protein